MKVLLSAYACEPNRGSEPGVGWNRVLTLARKHETWVITREKNRAAIEANPTNATFIYFDLPNWLRLWKRGRRGLHLYYYLWQIGAWRIGRRLHSQIGFDLIQHVTFVIYWMPSFLALLPAPFVWGPVGGAEAAPSGLRSALSWRGRLKEFARDAAQWLGRHDPFVRMTARRSALALAATPETAKRLKALGCRNIQVCPAIGLPEDEVRTLGRIPQRHGDWVRFATIGELLPLKGVEFGLRAFARAGQGEYWVFGDGPERDRLERLCRELKITGRVKFWGHVPRTQLLEKLAEIDVLVFPALHDSGGFACLEAMAAGRPVICLNVGGPALQVTDETGIRIAPGTVEQTINGFAWSMARLAVDASLRMRMGEAARERARRVA
jgi:glycosyltransferase involved in cell wall biosynthesis